MKKHISRLIIFIIALAVAFILTAVNNRLGNAKISLQHVTKTLHNQETSADNIYNVVREEALESPYIFEGRSCEVIRKEGFHGFLFYESEITFWSDNQISVHKETLKNISNDTLLYTGNLITLCKFYSWEKYRLYILIPVKQNFGYENRYLKNIFPSKFRLHPDTEILVNENEGYQVKSSEGEYLFSLQFSDNNFLRPVLQLFILLSYFLALVFLTLFMLELYRILPPFNTKPLLRVTIFAVDMFVVWLLLKVIGLPEYVSDTLLFSSSVYAHNVLISSLGDLVVIAILFFVTSYAWFMELPVERRHDTISKRQNTTISAILIALVVFVVYCSFVLIYSLVVNSTISFDLTSLFELNLYSIIGFFVMVLLLSSSWMLLSSLIRYLTFTSLSKNKYLLIIGLFLVLFVVFLLLIPIAYPKIIIALTVAFVIFCTIEFFFFGDRVSPRMAVLVIAVFSLICGLLLNRATGENSESEMRLIALSVSNQRDRVAEFLFEESVEEMYKDSELERLARDAVYNTERESVLEEYVKNNYLSGYWKQFDYQITACDDYVDLSFGSSNNVMNCNDYFSGIISLFGVTTFGEHLYFINDSSGMVSYLGQIQLPPPVSELDTVTLYFDIIPKYIQEGLGYPELMIDGQFENTIDYAKYSWAMYLNGTLVRNVGDYFYSSKLARYTTEQESDLFFKHNDWKHFLYRAGDEMTVIISKPSSRFIDIIAPFSYLFLYISVVVILLYGIYLSTRRNSILKFTTRNRLQIFVTGFLFLSLAVVGYSSVRYILVLNDGKNRENLQEKAHSVLTELEHKLISEKQFDAELHDYLLVLFTKWSNVFFSDINLYSPTGELLVSSRQEIFEENLTSRRMDASAYKALAMDRKTQYICSEQIGSYTYLSAWVQFRNADNELVAYLNLPFFARQRELSREVSVFLMTFINIYVLLIVIALLMGLLLSNIVARPLERIRDKMGKLSLGGDNEKLEWYRDDEIGALVKEYNAKVDELAINAEKLAQNERESAWREMARQVAHEIKNPLTPMKLSVQYLKRAWDDEAPDFDQRVERFTETMTEQIDSMAEIATAFSDFARMPKAQQQILYLNDLISNGVGLFNETPGITIDMNLTTESTEVFADGKQLIRVFNNLINNSLQALDGRNDGKIRIETWREEDTVMVLFADNGSGIPKDQTEKIFAPNFTTKSGGMGLGLAMVKNIVLNSGGQVWFESNGETVFYISLPAYMD